MSVEVGTSVRTQHGLKVSSDVPAFMAVDSQQNTFRLHKGKLTRTELDKFVRQVESGTLNVVRKLSSFKVSVSRMIFPLLIENKPTFYQAALTFPGVKTPVSYSGEELSLQDRVSFCNIGDEYPSSVTFKGEVYTLPASWDYLFGGIYEKGDKAVCLGIHRFVIFVAGMSSHDEDAKQQCRDATATLVEHAPKLYRYV